MKLKSILILSFLILSCQNQAEEARKPKVKTIEPTPFTPINNEVISKAVLYEANIRQYSNEGSFNAFAEDLPVLKKMGVKIIWLMPITNFYLSLSPLAISSLKTRPRSLKAMKG